MPAGNKPEAAVRTIAGGRSPQAIVPSSTASQLARLHALKDHLEDIIDSWTSIAPPGSARRSARGTSAASSPGPRLGIVVGHTAKAPGGSGLASAGPSEYLWNKDLAEKIKTAGAAAGIEVGIFLRDGIGIAGAYRELADWGAAAAIELHYNNHDGSVRGTETLWGPACPKSEAWATAIQAAMVALYNRTGKQNRGLKQAPPFDGGRDSVNALSTIPSCLIEPFFGDNPDDVALGGANKTRLAEALVSVFVARF
ncbi:MAG: N-acetylmuramoyl-L-alanine amidase, partial [Akkermansiaceae bacterium]|nr:N-acetylmuramoyl-L-alanine amidase [Akkermansiaceae bacterium]